MAFGGKPLEWKINLAASVVTWFSSSALCTVNAKWVLEGLAPRTCGLTVTVLQFAFSSVAAVIVVLVLGLSPLRAALLPRVVLISLAYTLGFLFLNLSLGGLQHAPLVLPVPFAILSSNEFSQPRPEPTPHTPRISPILPG